MTTTLKIKTKKKRAQESTFNFDKIMAKQEEVSEHFLSQMEQLNNQVMQETLSNALTQVVELELVVRKAEVEKIDQ